MTRFYFRWSFLTWLRRQWHGHSVRRPQIRRRAPLNLELLETRVTPATLTDTGSVLTINIDQPNETLTISGTSTSQYTLSSTAPIFNAGLTGATFSAGTLTLAQDASIDILDDAPGAAVNFGKGDAGNYDFHQGINVDLRNLLSGNVTFTGTGTLTFDGGLTVSTLSGDITQSSASSVIAMTRSSELSLTAENGAINLPGAINDPLGNVMLMATGDSNFPLAINAPNTANDFGSSLSLGGGTASTEAASATIVSDDALNLAGSENNDGIDVAAIAGNLTVTTVTGDITQLDPISVGGAASFNAEAGNVSLFNSGNIFTGDVSASVSTTSSNSIALDNNNASGNFQIGTILMGSGDLTLDQDSSSGDVTEDSTGGGITTSGNVSVDLNGYNFFGSGQQNVMLAGAPNKIDGNVSVYNSNFGTGNFALWNTSSLASVGNLSFSSFEIDDLTLRFDHAAIDATDFDTLVDFADNGSFGNLTLTAQSITQDTSSGFDAVEVSDAASFTATTGSVSLGNTSNEFQQDISASAASGSIQIDNSYITTTLGTITLGTGTLTINDDSTQTGSSITEDPMAGGITTAATTAGAVAINITSDSTPAIDLSSANNSFGTTAGLVAINGALGGSEGDFGFGTDNTFASNGHNGNLNEVSFTNFTIDNLTAVFSGAAVNVALANLASTPLPLSGGPSVTSFQGLSVTAGGNITQSAAITATDGLNLTVLGSTSGITLTNDSNNVSGAFTVTTPASDTGSISLENDSPTNPLLLGDCALGKTTFTVTAAGANGITEEGDSSITQSSGAPAAAFDIAGTATSIDLSAGQANFFAVTPTFAESGNTLTVISVEDANPAASVASFITNVHAISSQASSVFAFLNLTLDGATSSAPLAAEAIGYSLNVTTTNDIVLPSGVDFAIAGAHNLTLISEVGDINLFGQLAIDGVTTLHTESGTNAADNITANNPANSFGTLDLISDSFGGGTITIVSANTLTFGTSTIATASLTATADAGSIQQAASTSISDGGNSDFVTQNGAINLNQASNSFTAPVSASTDTTVNNGNGAITLGVGGSIILGTLEPQLGAITIMAPNGISESSDFDGIQCSASSTATLSLTVTSGGVDLSAAGNNIPSGVSLSITGGPNENFGLQNVSSSATLSQVAFHTFTTSNLTVDFPNTSINYNTATAAFAFSNTGTLALTAGGSITQTSAIATSGAASFTLTSANAGDGSIVLTNAGNSIGGSVSFSAPNADNKQQVSFTNSKSINLASATIGLARFNLTATGTGSINESGTLTQAKGGGAINLSATGNTISLGNSGNEITGPVTFTGPNTNLTNINFANDDPLAVVPKLNGLTAILNSVTFDLANAPVVLGNFNTATLNVSAGGKIAQAANTSLVVSGEATFNAGTYAIQLTNGNNNINEISLNNAGENAVALTTNGALIIDSSTLGSGPLSITAGGAITESGNNGIVQMLGSNALAGTISLNAGNNPILLDNTGNVLLGPIAVTTTGVNGNVTIFNSADTTTLGADTIAGALSLIADTGNITQAPGASLNVTGQASLSAFTGIDLMNPGNNIGGTISLDANNYDGDTNTENPGAVSLTLTGAATLAACTVNGGMFNLTAGLTILQSSGNILASGGSFTSTGGSITLTDGGNDFGDTTLTLSAPAGGVSVTDVDSEGMQIGSVAFGAAGLSLAAAGDVNIGGQVTGIGAVMLTNTGATSASLTMLDPGNDVTGIGSFQITGFGDITITNQGNIALTPNSTVTSTSQVLLNAGGAVNVDNGVNGTLTLGNLNVTANQINVNVNITATDVLVGGNDAISFTGAVTFTGSVTLNIAGDTAGSDVSINGNVSASSAVTVDLPSQGKLLLTGGTWTQTGGSTISVNGPGATMDVQAGATLNVSAGDTIIITGEPAAGGAPTTGNSLKVEGTLQVAGGVTLSDGGTGSILAVNFTGTLLDSFASLGVLTLNGANASDQIDIAPSAILSGFGGTAPANSTAIVQIVGGGTLVDNGSTSQPANQQGQFLMGTDIVTTSQTPTTLSIKQVAATATASSATAPALVVYNESDGDKTTITASDGAAGLSLTVISVGNGAGADIVVRGATAPTTLTIATTANGGDGFTRINGIAIDGSSTAAATITAATANVLNGSIITAGPLTSLSLHNWTNGFLQTAPSATVSASITGAVFSNVNMTLGTATLGAKLNALTLAADTGTSTIMAASFGTIIANGAAASGTPGNFAANLVSTNKSAGTALTAATIAGTLSGNWDLAGSVGAVTVGTATAPGSTTGWALGVANGPGVVNAGLLTNVTTLTLGTASNISILAQGNIATLNAISVADTGAGLIGTLQAATFGAINITGSAITNDHGNFLANITATGSTSVSRNALNTLTVAGDLGEFSPPITLSFLNGNVGTITVGDLVQGADIDAQTGPGVGNIGTITAGAIEQCGINANSITTIAAKGNLAAQLFGSFSENSVVLTGTLGTLSVSGDAGDNTVDVGGGSLTSFTVGGTLSSTFVSLTSTASTASLGTISAGEWNDDTVTARTIGTLKSTGRPATSAATSALNGDIEDTTITAFEPVGQTTPGIGTLSATGAISSESPGSDWILANNGITTFTAGRNVTDMQIAVNLNGGVGGIGALTAGAWNATDIAASFLGAVNITGYLTPEQTGGFVNGDVTDSDFVLTGASSTAHGINSMTVQHNLGDNSQGVFISAPFGIGSLTVTGTILGPSFQNSTIDTRNALTASAGSIGTLTSGEIQDVNIYADEVTGTTGISVVGKAALGLNGDFIGSTLAVAAFTGLATAPIGVTSFTVAGKLGDPTGETTTSVEVADGMTTFSVGQTATQTGIAVAFDPVNTNAAVKSLSFGSANNLTLAANSIATFNVDGNANFGLAGNLTSSKVTLLGNLASVALGTFTATGRVQGVDMQVTSGNVTSFKTAYFISSGLFVGYTMVDALALTDAANNGQAANWNESPPGSAFTLGSFTTTAVLNNASASTIARSAGLQTSDIVAGKLGTVTISGLNPTPLSASDVTSFGVAFRATGGLPATSFTVNGVAQQKNNPISGSTSAFYVGLTG